MLRVLVCFLIGVVLVATPAQATIVQLSSGGVSSGWQVDLRGAVTGVSNIAVDLSAGTVTFDVQKDYGPMIGVGEDAKYPVGLMIFHEVLPKASTVTKVIIREGTITNDTGTILNEFRWILSPTGCAHFDTTSAWNVAPFTDLQWVSQYQLVATQGAVVDGEEFEPSGGLTILANRNGDFQLKGYVAPEPASMALMAAAGLCVAGRRRTRARRNAVDACRDVLLERKTTREASP